MVKGNVKNLIVNLVILGVTSVLCLAFAEIVLRWYGIVPTTDRLYAYEFDEVLGWTPKKSFTYFRSRVSYSIFNYYNPDGLPTTKEEFTQSADKHKPSIVFLGDSFAEGYYLPYELTFPYLLGKELGEQVVNLGVSGYAPDQCLLTARRHLPQYNISKIIVTFFPHNDIPDLFSDEYLGYAKPLFGEDLDAPINVPLRHIAKELEEETWLQALAHSSALYAAMRPLIRKYFDMPVAKRKNPISYTRDQMKRALSMIKQIQKEFPADPFLVYYIPVYDEIAENTLEGNLQAFPEVCDELTLQCFSLKEILNQVEKPEEYYGEDGHFSQEGAAAVAEHLYRILSEN